MSLAPTPDNRWGCAQWGCAALVALVLGAIFLPVFSGPGRVSTSISMCLSNVKQLSQGLQMYTQDYEEHLPPAAAWHDRSLPYVKNEGVYVCPKRPQLATAYAFNQLLDGASVHQSPAPDKTPLLFESSLGQRNGADQLQSFITPHNKGGSVGFLDGHVKRSTMPPAADAGLKGARE